MVWFTVRYVQIVINTSCPQHCQAPTYISTISKHTYTAFRNRIFVHYYFDNDPHLSLLHAVSCYKWKQSTGALQVTTWSILLLVGECVIAPRKMCICIYIPVFCFYTAVMWGATLVILNITILPSTIDTCILLLGERITRTTQPRSLTTDYPSPPLTFPVWTNPTLLYTLAEFHIIHSVTCL